MFYSLLYLHFFLLDKFYNLGHAGENLQYSLLASQVLRRWCEHNTWFLYPLSKRKNDQESTSRKHVNVCVHPLASSFQSSTAD